MAAATNKKFEIVERVHKLGVTYVFRRHRHYVFRRHRHYVFRRHSLRFPQTQGRGQRQEAEASGKGRGQRQEAEAGGRGIGRRQRQAAEACGRHRATQSDE